MKNGINKGIYFDFKKLRVAACCYIALPLLVFFGGFLKWYFALPGIAALVFTLKWAVASENVEEKHVGVWCIKKSQIALIFLFVLIWTFLGGLNGFFYQSSDWNCRNAIYHDLIEFEWPVIYESTGAALVYYIGHWLPTALVGKLVLWLTGSIQWAWLLGKMAFWIWSCLGLFIVIMLMLHYLKVTSTRKGIWAILLFVGFSGMDIVGAICKGNLAWLTSPEVLHLEWWSKYQYSAITTCVYWVFNQTIVPWIITLCFLMEEDPRNYVFYCVACLICGPFPCVGIAICMIVKALHYCAKKIGRKHWKDCVKRVFSPSNMVAFVFVFPFVAAFILANNAVTASTETAGSIIRMPFFSLEYWDIELVCFLTVEVGCYLFLIFNKHKRNPMFYGLIVIFVISPYFYIGATNDFCMRVSVPAVFILMLYVNEYLQHHFTWKSLRHPFRCSWCQLCAFGLVLCLLVGAATPVMEVFRGVYHVVTEGTILLEDMSIGSFDKGTVYLNFNCTEPENTFFFRYLAR